MKSSRSRDRQRIPSAYANDLAKSELVNLYLADREFSEQFEQLVKKHKAPMSKLLRLMADEIVEDRSVIQHSGTEIVEILIEDAPVLLAEMDLVGRLEPLAKLVDDSSIEDVLQCNIPLECVGDITKLIRDIRTLAATFGLDFPWAVLHLFCIAVRRNIPKVGLSANCAEPLKLEAARLLVESTPMPPFSIEIPAAIILWLPESRVLEQIKWWLQDYKDSLARSGVYTDTDDAMRKQIHWLFAHKRYRLSAKEILRSEEYLGDKVVGYSQIGYAIRKWNRRLRG